MSAVAATRRSYKELVDGTLRVQIDIEPSDKATFLELFPEPGLGMAVAALRVSSPVPHEQQPAEARPYGQYAKALRLNGFCRAPDVWRAAGTDAEFREWIQKQPSWHSGKFSEYVNGEGRCIAAHVRRVANGAGTSIKPEYACVPLTDAEHSLQHQDGESALATTEEWDRARIEYVEQWCWNTIKSALKRGSMAAVPPHELESWAIQHGVENYLPACYRTANA